MNQTIQNRLFIDDGASFSDCRAYRYALWRIWDIEKPFVMFIGLNPSTANEHEPDPTITRVKGFARDLGFGGFFMMNLFPFVTAYPEELQTMDAIHQEINDIWLARASEKCQSIIFAWGNFKVARQKSKEVITKFRDGLALIINKNGSPRHPLYVKATTIPIKYAR